MGEAPKLNWFVRVADDIKSAPDTFLRIVHLKPAINIPPKIKGKIENAFAALSKRSGDKAFDLCNDAIEFISDMKKDRNCSRKEFELNIRENENLEKLRTYFGTDFLLAERSTEYLGKYIQEKQAATAQELEGYSHIKTGRKI